jgi:hypothetical protein
MKPGFYGLSLSCSIVFVAFAWHIALFFFSHFHFNPFFNPLMQRNKQRCDGPQSLQRAWAGCLPQMNYKGGKRRL